MKLAEVHPDSDVAVAWDQGYEAGWNDALSVACVRHCREAADHMRGRIMEQIVALAFEGPPAAADELVVAAYLQRLMVTVASLPALEVRSADDAPSRDFDVDMVSTNEAG